SRSSIASSAPNICQKTPGRRATAWSAAPCRAAFSGSCWRRSSGTRRSTALQRNLQPHVVRLVGAGGGRLDQSQDAHDPDRHVAEVELAGTVCRAEQVRIVVMVVLPAG